MKLINLIFSWVTLVTCIYTMYLAITTVHSGYAIAGLISFLLSVIFMLAYLLEIKHEEVKSLRRLVTNYKNYLQD